ncbi:MAG: hypothetical protein JWO19_3907 [Bryobacterales bacterium]|nr:hypothetical protein [Bryobacterales bacterium]
MSYVALAVGTVVVQVFFALAGRLTGLSVLAIWSAATAYFLMPPQYSFRISNAGDLAAIALFGTAGLVFARTLPGAKRPIQNQPDLPGRKPTPTQLLDLETVLSDVTSSPHLCDHLRRRQIEVASCLPRFRCSYIDALRILSNALDTVLLDPQVRRVSFNFGQRPGVSLLFVTGLRAWPLPLQKTITIGRIEEDCEAAEWPWPSDLHATWFDNEYGRVYQIAFRGMHLVDVGRTSDSEGDATPERELPIRMS